MPHALRALALSAVLATAALSRPAAADPNEMARLLASYDLSLATAQKAASFHESLARWAKANPAEVAELRKKDKPVSLEAAIARFEGNPAIKKLLDEAGIGARDALLVPLALAATGAIILGEGSGHKMPPEAVNPRNVALMKSEKVAMEALLKRINDARATLAPKR